MQEEKTMDALSHVILNLVILYKIYFLLCPVDKRHLLQGCYQNVCTIIQNVAMTLFCSLETSFYFV